MVNALGFDVCLVRLFCGIESPKVDVFASQPDR